jgi:hypothetical protein
MVAQVSTETFSRTSRIPRPEPSDSDDMMLALETARALEAQGEIREAARWLKRALEQAESEGSDERVLVLARAAADLKNALGPASSPATGSSSLPPSGPVQHSSIRPPAPKPANRSHAAPPLTPAPRASSPPAAASAPTAARVSSPPPKPSRIPSLKPQALSSATTPPRISPASKLPPRSSPLPASAGSSLPSVSPRAITARAANVAEKAVTERTARVATLRVAIPVSSRDANVFVVRRLAAGQPLPPGTTEATLVLTGDREPAD